MLPERDPDPRWSALLPRGGDPEASVGRRAESLSTRIAPSAGSAPTPPSAATLPTGRIAREEVGTGARPFRILGALGRGGFGEVVLAEQVALGREVAVKILARDDVGRRAAFRREGVLCAGLEHPHIIPIHDAGDDFLVLKRLGGRTLDAALRCWNDGPRRTTKAVEALIAVADALAYAHDRGVVHRDIKPANIMLGTHGEVWLLDWDLAHRHGEADDDAVRCSGTPALLPPETARGEPAALGPAADVFLLGATLFCVLAGRPPWAAGSARESLALAAAGSVPPLPDTAPARLAALCRTAMASDPALRPTAAAIADGLRQWLRSSRGEAEASAACAEARIQLEAIAPGSGAAAYPALAETRILVERATSLCPDLPGLAGVHDTWAAAATRAAIAAGDLGLAQLRLGEAGGPAAAAARHELHRTIEAHRRRQRQTRIARHATVGAVLALTALAIGSLALERHARSSASGQRRAEAAALLADAPRTPDSSAAFEDSIGRAERAAGLDPDGGAATAVACCRLAFGRWALAHDDPALAEAQCGALPATEASLLAADIAAAARRRGQAQADRREALAGTLEAIALRGNTGQDGDTQLIATAASQLETWQSRGDAGGEAFRRGLVASAFAAQDRRLRMAAVHASCLRGGPDCARTFLPALREPRIADAAAASNLISEIQDEATRWPHLAQLAARTGELRWSCLPGNLGWCYQTLHDRRDELRERMKLGITASLRTDIAELAAAWYVLEGGGLDAWRILGDDPQAKERIAVLEQDPVALNWSFQQACIGRNNREIVAVGTRYLAILERDHLDPSQQAFLRICIKRAREEIDAPVGTILKVPLTQTSDYEIPAEMLKAVQAGRTDAFAALLEQMLAQDSEFSKVVRGSILWGKLTAKGYHTEALLVARRVNRPEGVESILDFDVYHSLFSLGRYVEAEHDCAVRLAANPGNERVQLMRADCLMHLDRGSEAANICEEMFARSMPSGLIWLARCKRQQGDSAAAIAIGLRMLPLTDYDPAEAMFDAAATAAQAGFAGDEAVLLRRCLELDRDDSRVGLRLGRILLGAGAPHPVLAIIAAFEKPEKRRRVLANLALAIPALRTRPAAGESAQQLSWRCLSNALADAALPPVAGLPPPRPALWLELSAQHAAGDPLLAQVGGIIIAAAAGDADRVVALGTAAGTALDRIPDPMLALDLKELATTAREHHLVRPWFRASGWASHPLPDFIPDRAWLDEAIRIWRTTGEGPSPFDGITPGPDLPDRTVDDVIRTLPRLPGND